MADNREKLRATDENEITFSLIIENIKSKTSMLNSNNDRLFSMLHRLGLIGPDDEVFDPSDNKGGESSTHGYLQEVKTLTHELDIQVHKLERAVTILETMVQ